MHPKPEQLSLCDKTLCMNDCAVTVIMLVLHCGVAQILLSCSSVCADMLCADMSAEWPRSATGVHQANKQLEGMMATSSTTLGRLGACWWLLWVNSTGRITISKPPSHGYQACWSLHTCQLATHVAATSKTCSVALSK